MLKLKPRLTKFIVRVYLQKLISEEIKYICIFDFFSVFIIENYFMVRKTIKTIKKELVKKRK